MNEKTKGELDALKNERSAEKAEVEATGNDNATGSETGRKTRAKSTRKGRKPKAAIADEMFPVETWRSVTDFILDGATSAANTAERSEEEKQAFSVTSRAVAAKRLPTSQYAEEIMFGIVVVPIALSIFFEALANYKERRAAANGTQEQAHAHTREIGVGKDVSSFKSH